MRRPLAVLAVLALSLTACGDADPDIPAGTAVDEPAVDLTEDLEEDAEPDDDVPETTEDTADVEAAEDDAEDAPEGDLGGDASSDAEGGADATADAGPQADDAAIADPCAPHQDREAEAFIDLVAPVQDQVVTDEVTIVGCSNVHEATVSWRLLDGDGRTLDEGFTTAECGTGCVGAFEDTIDLEGDAASEAYLYLQVFWADMSDGSDRDLTEVGIVVDR